MLTVLCLTLAATRIEPSVADYFPLTPGTKWVYQEEMRFMVSTYVDEVMAPVEVGGAPATPIVTSRDGKVDATYYYRISGNTVYLVAYDPKAPLNPPRPILRLGEKKETWDYVGLTPMVKDPVPLKVKGESSAKGRRKVLDKDVECVEVKFDAQMGRTTVDLVLSKQTAIYAKGIGLVEMISRTTIDRVTDEGKLKLVEFKPATS